MSKWYKASELERARTPMVMSSEMGLPDNHVITVTERVISIDNTELIQNNIATDTFTLVLDAEWDDITPVVIFSNDTGKYSVMYEGSATKIPAKAMERVGDIQVSVYGLNDEGDVRVVTQKPDSMGMTVIESGEFNGQVSADDVSLLGQILQAVSDAEAAITEAETATTAATNATTQATSAATKANSAASSANTAASSANSAATKANSAAVDAQNAYDTLQPYMATVDSCANILHREVGPDSVVTADDSFPAKPVEMVVYGNTTQNLWVNPNGTSSGVTVTSNADGSMTISGTSTGDFYIYSTIYSLKPGSTYTLSIDKAITAVISIQAYNSDGYISDNASIGSNGYSTNKAVLPQNATYARLMIQGTAGRTLSGTYRVMLNEGSTAEPWCPPGLNSVGDGGNVKVVTAGKNLLKFRDNLQPHTINGLTFTPNEDGTVTVNGTATANDTDYYVVGTSWVGRADANLPARDLVFSTNGIAKMYGYDSNGAGVIGVIINNGQSQIAASKAQACAKVVVYLSYANGRGEANKDVYVQLELGSTATAYEPPNITTTPIDLQGHTLNALPDGTRDELHIDGGGNVVLEKRCGVATAPTEAGSWLWDSGFSRGRFALPATSRNKGTWNQSTELLCDKLPPATSVNDVSHVVTVIDAGYAKNPAITSTATATYIYPLAEPQTIDLGTITPPIMAAPNVTAYVADDTPAEMELDYVRDINIVVDRLEAKIADLVTKEAANV